MAYLVSCEEVEDRSCQNVGVICEKQRKPSHPSSSDIATNSSSSVHDSGSLVFFCKVSPVTSSSSWIPT
nr:hypothetical protein [Tanacetum cinerariifolium]